MEEIFAVKNPRRRRSHRRRHRARHRRNPEMLAIGNPRHRRRRRHRRSHKYFSFSMQARKNPFGGKVPILGYPISSLMYLAVGATGTSFLSGLVVKWVPFLQPQLLPAGAQPTIFERSKPYLVDLVAAFGTAKLAGMIFKSKQAENEVLTGGLAVPLLRLLRTELYPRIGLSGPDDFDEANFSGVGYFDRPGSHIITDRYGMGYFDQPGKSILHSRDGLGAFGQSQDWLGTWRRNTQHLFTN